MKETVFGVAQMQGRRNVQEDRYFMIPNLATEDLSVSLDSSVFDVAKCSLVGVLDGHCGSLAAEFGCKSLPQEIIKKFALISSPKRQLKCAHDLYVEGPRKKGKCMQHSEKEQETFTVPEINENVNQPKEAMHLEAPESQDHATTGENPIHNQIMTGLREAFQAVDDEFFRRFRNRNDGAAAIVGFIYNQETLFVASLGDCRAVIGIKKELGPWETQALTEDHKPSLPSEVTRIQNAGGMVIRSNGCYRVTTADYQERCLAFKKKLSQGPQSEGPPIALAVSRALGDRPFKQPKMILSNDPVVTSRDLQDLEVVVLGCDGIFDVLNNKSVIGIMESQKHDVQTGSRRLLSTAFSSGSQDNLTAVVTRFLSSKEDQVVVTTESHPKDYPLG